MNLVGTAGGCETHRRPRGQGHPLLHHGARRILSTTSPRQAVPEVAQAAEAEAAQEGRQMRYLSLTGKVVVAIIVVVIVVWAVV